MSDVGPSIVLIAALLAAVYLFHRLGMMPAAGAAASVAAPPPGAPAGTVALGQFAVRPGAQWMVLQPGYR